MALRDSRKFLTHPRPGTLEGNLRPCQKGVGLSDLSHRLVGRIWGKPCPGAVGLAQNQPPWVNTHLEASMGFAIGACQSGQTGLVTATPMAEGQAPHGGLPGDSDR